ncbi:MAG TPA: toprim domain-containing protein [Nitrososphaerales archaeon]|nr:toprim domain-containing protein [Nitrososphaerales archaeon]
MGMERAEERKFAEFTDFLKEFVTELNLLAEEGCVLLVEGARDARAMRDVGYRGIIVSISALRRGPESRLASSKNVVIMTDLDREGRRLAARYAKSFTHRGLAVSLDQRRRLLAASRGVFRHIENLKRFSHIVTDVEIQDTKI